MDAKLTAGGVRLEVRAIDPKHANHGKATELAAKYYTSTLVPGRKPRSQSIISPATCRRGTSSSSLSKRRVAHHSIPVAGG